MKFLSLFFCFFSLTLAHSAVPTPEGLLRNANNAELNGKVVDIKLMISSEISEPIYLRLFLQLNDSGRVSVLQARFRDSGMKENSLAGLVYDRDLEAKLKSSAIPSQGLFYSIASMLFANNSALLLSQIKMATPTFPANKELIDDAKVELLNRYREYLTSIKENPGLKESMVSPLKPTDNDARLKVKELSEAPFFRNSSLVKLIRAQNEFYWELNTESVVARFTNEKHQIVSFDYGGAIAGLSFQFTDYILFNGVQEVPRTIVIKEREGATYEIRTLEMNNYDFKSSSLEKIRDSWTKRLPTEPQVDNSIHFLF
jgi:hypothetical protein